MEIEKLMSFIENGYLPEFSKLLDDMLNKSELASNYNKILIHALIHNQCEMAKMLLKFPAVKNLAHCLNNLPLRLAAEKVI